jgi:hypothetical protein
MNYTEILQSRNRRTFLKYQFITLSQNTTFSDQILLAKGGGDLTKPNLSCACDYKS